MKFSIHDLFRTMSILLIGTVIMSSIPLYPVAAATFSGGDGSAQSPYLIEDASQLNAIRNNLSASYKLTQNIDLFSYASADGGKGWRPIEGSFVGQLDGDGYRITGLSINRGDEDKVGLFQSIQFGQVHNLSIVGASVVGKSQVGVLAGYLYQGAVENVHVSGQVEGESYLGGLIGEVQHMQISGSGANVEVDGSGSFIGGLIGSSANSSNYSIVDSYAEGNVYGQGDYVGGLVGHILEATIERSYAAGNVAGGSAVGGLLGRMDWNSAARDSYSLGSVTGNSSVGGFAGVIYDSDVRRSYSLGTVTANSMAGGIAGYVYNWSFDDLYWNSDAYWAPFFFGGGEGIYDVSGSDLFKAASFGGLDFGGAWAIAEGKSYPYLQGNAPLWLTDLTVTPNTGTAGNISPAWQSFIYEYDLSVTGDTTSLTASPSVSHTESYAEFVGLSGLVPGANAATITINDANGVKNPQVYNLNIHKLTSNELSSDATLADLRIDNVSIDGFNSNTMAYSTVVPNSSASVSVTAVPTHPDAIYTVTGSDSLDLGDNTVRIIVTASDGTTRTYTVTITRNRFAGGNGTEDSPYLIQNADQFNEIRNDHQKAYRLIADIDLAPYATANGGEGWEPIYFEGKLDGNGHVIKGLRINRPYEDVVGLFNYIYLGSVTNLEIVQASIVGRDEVGILAGVLNPIYHSNLIANIRTSGTVTGSSQVGGLAGSLSTGTIRASSSLATVEGSGEAVGGLVGQSFAVIETSYAEGDVQGGTRVGGLVGNVSSGTVTNSFASGKVVANGASAGGLIGRSSQGTFTNIYAAGEVQGSSAVGGLVGTRSSGTYTRGYWNTTASGLGTGTGSGSSTGLTGYSTEQMKSSASFSGWDFNNVWGIESVTTPYLRSAPLPLWLRSLTVVGNTGESYSISPELDNLNSTYAVAVAHDVDSVTVAGTAIDPSAVITANGGSSLSVGANTVTVTVTDSGGHNSREYRLNVMRYDPSGAGLSGLTLSSGILNPIFAEATTHYSVNVPYTTASIAVTSYASNIGSTIKVNGVGVISGQASGYIELTAGASTDITVEATSLDGSNTRIYTVSVTREAGSSNANLSALTISAGASLSPSFSAATTSYTASVANGTSSVTVRPTVADYTASLTVSVNGGTAVPTTSGQNSSALALHVGSNTIVITVMAQDGSEKQYSISVTRAASADATLSGLTLSSGAFSPNFLSSSFAYTATVANNISSVTVRPTASNSNATIAVAVNGGDPVAVDSGTDSALLQLNTGANTIQVIVLAQDGMTTRTYTITVTRSQSSANDLTSFSFEGLSPAVTGTFNGTDITLMVPYGTNVGELVATFADSDESTVTVGGTVQTSGVTSNDFTSPVIYTVTAQDGSVKSYTVTVTVAANTENDLTTYSYAGLTPPVIGTIAGTNVALTVPYGTDVTALVATFAASAEATVEVGGVAQTSGVTSNDFTSPVVYTVTAENGSVKSYTVTVTVAANTENDLTTYSYAGLTPPVIGTIAGTNVALTVPYGTDVTALVATFAASAEAIVEVGGVAQTSAATSNDFTSPVIYTVTAENGSVKSYTVRVTIASRPPSGGGSGGNVNTAPKDYEEIVIKAGQSGTFSRESEINISIPSGAMDKDMILKVKRVTDTKDLQNNGELLISPVYELLKDLTSNFLKSITIRLYFDSAMLNNNQKPSIFYYDEQQKVWIELGGVVEGTSISVEVDHFTKFAVLPVPVSKEPEEEPSPTFVDIEGHWAAATIMQALAAGIVSGYDDGTFRPNTSITRAEFAVLLVRTLKLQGEGAELHFSDNRAIGSWAKSEIALAVKEGIINGYPDGSFRPDSPITRTEMAVMIAKAQHIQLEANATTTFADDADIPAWSKGAIKAIAKQGIVQGRGSNQFAPMATASRAEAIAVLMKLIEIINN